jgi:membrane-associated phospholipid phosphatase
MKFCTSARACAPVLVCVCLFFTALTASAQNVPDTIESVANIDGEPHPGLARRIARSTSSRFGTLVRDEALMWTSPVRSSRSMVKTILPLAAITGAAFAFDRRIASGLPNSADQVRFSKRVSVAGTYYSLGAAAGAFVGVGALTGNSRAVETGIIVAQAVAHTESIAQMLKYAAGRERPDFGDAGGGRFWRRQQSFPSGHAMGTWAAAAVISREYHHNRFIRYGVYALPILVSASRIGAQRHFLADVVGGGSIGYLMGVWLYDRHHDPALGGRSKRIGSERVSLKPGIGFDRRSGGVTFSLNISR